jgi:hypothetical protein
MNSEKTGYEIRAGSAMLAERVGTFGDKTSDELREIVDNEVREPGSTGGAASTARAILTQRGEDFAWLTDEEKAELAHDWREERILVNSVGFLYQERTDSGTYKVLAMGDVDSHGHVSVTPPARTSTRRREQRAVEMQDHLVDNDLAEWRAVGSGDSELYALPKLMEQVGPALAALPRGWQDIS